jgi:hypothetical protein
MKFVYAFSLTILGAAVLFAIHWQLGGPPDPRLGGCDPNDIIGSQALELTRLSSWLFSREILAAILALIAAYLLLYCQVLHGSRVPVAWAGRAALLGLIAVASGFWVKGIAQEWAASTPGTCLAEALQASPATLAIVGRLIPVDWPWAVFVDGLTLAVVGAIVGIAGYSAARAARV